MYDVVIIGCGVIGASAAYELSKYKLSIAVLEKENDVACGATRANSAIIHAGFDPKPGTKMARLNVLGSQMMGELCEKLSVEYSQIGSLVLAFTEKEMECVRELYERGGKNQVPGLRILTRDEVLQIEPNVNVEVIGALHAPTAAIINPWGLCLALAQNAKINGVDIHLNSEVVRISNKGGHYHVETTSGAYDTRYIVNAAGGYSDKVSDMVAEPFFRITAVKGEYYILDKSQGDIVNHVLFQTPSSVGKGVLIAPTVHGNLIVGPTSEPTADPEDTSVSYRGLEEVVKKSMHLCARISFKESIRNFAGVRAMGGDDFILEASAPNFINAAAIKSPGLSSAPAIALEICDLLKENGLDLIEKDSHTLYKKKPLFKNMRPDEQKKVLELDRRYGRVICRCETITEGDIIEAIKAPVPPVSIDGVKRRCEAGSGRCQGGFCAPRVHEILSRETGRAMESICQGKAGSYILTGKTKTPGGGAV